MIPDHPDSSSSAEAFWTPKQLANRWQISERSVIRKLSCGDLIGHKFGELWRVSDADRINFERLNRRG